MNDAIYRAAAVVGRDLARRQQLHRVTHVVEREVHQLDGTVLIERHITIEED